jgi:hypothetical protein
LLGETSVPIINNVSEATAAAKSQAKGSRQRGATPRVIAIDGPAAAGKSTVGRMIAGRLGYPFLDTGAIYRAATWAALHRGVDLSDGDALSDLAASLSLDVGRRRQRHQPAPSS